MTTDLHTLAGAYALDALDPDERRRFEAHYPDCDTCRVEVEEFRAVAGEVATSIRREPPAHLRDQVLARIAETPQLSPAAPVIDLSERRAARRRTGALLAAAAAAVAVIGLSGALISISNDRDRAEQIAAAVADPDALVIDLDPTGDADGAIRVVWRPGTTETLILADGLDDPGSGRVHQLWALGAEGPVPAGLFDVEGPSEGRLTDLVDPAGWAVTVEPAGGSTAPTGEIVFVTT